jgi:hypothetical protein
MLKFIFSLALVFFSLSFQTWSRTNQGALNTLSSGFLQSDSCRFSETRCLDDSLHELFQILNFATKNQCIASELEYQNQGLELPLCPKEGDIVRGVDNTFPSGGMFAYFYGGNASFIHNLVTSYINDNPVGKFNLIMPLELSSSLIEQSNLHSVLNHPRVNIIALPQRPEVEQWMRDSFQFTIVNGEPSLLQLEHQRESHLDMETRLGCQIASQCNIPHYIPEDFAQGEPSNSNLDMGGNLEVLPGGTFIRGIVGDSGHGHNLPQRSRPPWQSPLQERQLRSLEANNNRVLDIDVSFSVVGHVDELVNIVRTNQESPCHFAVMIASPSKAFELLEQHANEQNRPDRTEQRRRSSFCRDNSFSSLRDRFRTDLGSERVAQEIYDNRCIDEQTIDEMVDSRAFRVLKRENLDGSRRIQAVQAVMDENRRLVEAELIETTGCQNPPFIEVPVIFRNGRSIVPNQVNSFVDTSSGDQASHIFAPRSYVAPFDRYLSEEMSKHGVRTSMIHDLEYHMMSGEVHCGTNEARLCLPRK